MLARPGNWIGRLHYAHGSQSTRKISAMVAKVQGRFLQINPLAWALAIGLQNIFQSVDGFIIHSFKENIVIYK
jgi:hypothetical protein